jgi:hypothetical protein
VGRWRIRRNGLCLDRVRRPIRFVRLKEIVADSAPHPLTGFRRHLAKPPRRRHGGIGRALGRLPSHVRTCPTRFRSGERRSRATCHPRSLQIARLYCGHDHARHARRQPVVPRPPRRARSSRCARADSDCRPGRAPRECDARQLYAAEGYPSLFEFCVARLRLSEAQAYHRIQAARAARRFPLVLERLREGRVSLTAVALLREHLTEANHREVLDWADGRRKREVEMFIRSLDPRPDVISIRRLAPSEAATPVAVSRDHARTAPAVAAGCEGARAETTSSATLRSPDDDSVAPMAVTGAVASAPSSVGSPAAPRADVHPTAPGRYSLRITISEDTHDKLRRAQDLLRHALPGADPALVIDRALTLLVAQLERRKAGAPRKPARVARRSAPAASRPRSARKGGAAECAVPGCASGPEEPAAAAPDRPDEERRPAEGRTRGRSRYIPAAVRRAVWDRDAGRCAFVSPSGIRCSASARLEFHHRVPFAEGGPSSVDNVSLACARHNRFEAGRWFECDRRVLGHQADRTRDANAEAD